MGEKTRPLGHFTGMVCFKGECIHHNTEVCYLCRSFDLYERKVMKYKTDLNDKTKRRHKTQLAKGAFGKVKNQTNKNK